MMAVYSAFMGELSMRLLEGDFKRVRSLGNFGFYFAGGAGFSAAWKNCPLKWWWWAAGRAG